MRQGIWGDLPAGSAAKGAPEPSNRKDEVIQREFSTLWANFHDQGWGMAAKYAAFRWQFSVHSRPVSWLINRLHPYPTMLEVEISTACDLRCTMCLPDGSMVLSEHPKPIEQVHDEDMVWG